jgi:ribose/xylose/arabinose/galactoside ABC-type transport system permease subunit
MARVQPRYRRQPINRENTLESLVNETDTGNQPTVDAVTASHKPGSRLRSAAQHLGLPAFIILLAGVTGFVEPRFWSSENLINLSRQIAPLLIISVGQAFAVISGGLDLSLAACLALSGVYGVMMMNEFGLLAGVATMLVTGVVVGTINGTIITRFDVSPLVVTLGTLSICRGLALMASGGLPIYEMPDSFIDIFGYGSILGIPTPTIIAILTLMAGAFILKKTIFGRYVYAIGSNETAAYSSGINVTLYKTLVYALAGLCAGIAAIVLTAWVNSAQPMAATNMELQAIAAVVLGGIALTGGSGTMLNALYGVIILGMLSNSLNMIGVSSFMQTLVIGVVIVSAVILDKMRRSGRILN